MPDLTIHLVTADFLRTHFLPWRCLHGGPLRKETVDAWDPGSAMPWAALRQRNVPLLQKLIDVYGACAVAAMDGDQVVGQLRFYPKAVWQMAGNGMLCMQQFPPGGPGEDFLSNHFPPQERLAEKTLVVHCLITCSAPAENDYRRKGIGTRLVQGLAAWAGQNGWEAIEATAYAELDILYQVTGQAGKEFWEKLGFRLVETGEEEGFFQAADLLRAMQAEAQAKGLAPASITQRYTMRYDV
jgi:hypothetical protein